MKGSRVSKPFTFEGRLPGAVPLSLLAFVVGNEREEHRAAVAAFGLAFEQPNSPTRS
ncbi:hypothetical protein X737_08930 [Mesorhizobium sp. L48C026A00]|nr:hypothetical protein X737_08930 [Mesorhizobium sp. L48C026A00]